MGLDFFGTVPSETLVGRCNQTTDEVLSLSGEVNFPLGSREILAS